MKIVYMGTPDFAVNPLHALAEAGYEVAGVVTQPDIQNELLLAVWIRKIRTE